MLFKDEMPFSQKDCPYSSEMYTYWDGNHHRCNYHQDVQDRPICDLTSGYLFKLPDCRVRRELYD